MANLILRPSGLSDPLRKWSLQLRWHGPAETDYMTLTRVSDDTAREIIAAGAPYWLFGEPKEPAPAEQCVASDTAKIARAVELRAERAQLVADNEKAAAWGAAVGARAERIKAIDAEMKSSEVAR